MAATLLELDLTLGLVEDIGSHPVERVLARRRLGLRTVIDRLASAARDPRVVGLLAKLGASSISLAQAQELSDAVVRFRASGKRTIAWAETFGELGGGQTAYVLAVAFDEVWLQPSGSVGLMGASTTGVFLRGVLDRAHIEPLLAQRHEYKGAADRLMRTGFTPAGREATERLAASRYEQIVSAVATGRRLPEGRVRELIDRAPIPAAEAREAGLVDHLGYRDAVRQAVDRQWGMTRPTLLYVSRYRPPWKKSILRARRARRPGVALIEAIGAIRTGPSRRGPVGRAAGSDTVGAAFRSAVRDERTKAIVFRVNSPGGSYIASDTIWREVCIARDAGKPVVVSMGDLAGSGGYFIAVAADVIVAQPATLTGSIGVVGGKFRSSGLFERLGVSAESLTFGRHARMFSSQTGFSEEEWAKLDEWLDLVYEDFTDKVARGRAMTRAAVDEVARGRVWTGADAADRGLIDELDGLRRAVEIARDRANLPPDAPLLQAPSLSPLGRLRRPRNSDDAAAFAQARGWSAHVGQWGEHADLAVAFGLPAAGPLTMAAAPLS
jgi:protease-4